MWMSLPREYFRRLKSAFRPSAFVQTLDCSSLRNDMDKQPNDKEEIPDAEPEAEDKEIDESLWSSDQKKRGYYYDDSYGYKIYNADEDEKEEMPLDEVD